MMKAPIESENEESDEDQDGEEDDSDEVYFLIRFLSVKMTMVMTPRINKTLITSFEFICQFRSNLIYI